MMVCRTSKKQGLATVVASILLTLSAVQAAQAQGGYAVVPTQVIYPGEEVPEHALEMVEVTNPNIARGYAETKAQVVGMISKRTLLPGRTIPLSGLRESFAVKRGANLRLTFQIGAMTISAAGTPLTDAAIGDVIKVRNIDSGAIVSGTVMADGTVQVMAK